MEANDQENQRQAELVAKTTRLRHWPAIAELLRVRAVPSEHSTGLARPLSSRLSLDIAIRLGPGLAKPQRQHLQSWARHPTEIWSRALANMARDDSFQVVRAEVQGLPIAAVTGPLYTGGLLADPARLIRPLLHDETSRHFEPRWITAPSATTMLLSQDRPRHLVRLAESLSAGLGHGLEDNLFQLGRTWSVRAA